MNEIMQLYAEQLRYDIGVMSQPWMYWCALIPACVYAAFMLVKWFVITCPLWMPFACVAKTLPERRKHIITTVNCDGVKTKKANGSTS